MGKNKWIYQLYKDNKLVDEGSASELARKYYTSYSNVKDVYYRKGLYLGEYVLKRRIRGKDE